MRTDCICIAHTKDELKEKIFPFSLATTVLLISFKETDDIEPGLRMSGDSAIYHPLPKDTVFISADTSGYKKLKEIIVLTKRQTDSLFNLCYNVVPYNYKLPHRISVVTRSCYEPRNAIIFLDSTSKVIAHIELCFECEEIRTMPDDLYMGEMCRNKVELYKSFFAWTGIKYGVKPDGTN